MNRRTTTLPLVGLCLLAAACGTESPTELPLTPAAADVTVLDLGSGDGPVAAATASASYREVTVSLEAPDAADELADFLLEASGTLANASPFTITAWSVWEDADWSYDPNHLSVVASGTRLALKSFNFGATVLESLVLNRPAGTYRFTFFFGPRSAQHGFYDVGVDLEVVVGPSGPALCDVGWLPPDAEVAKAGRTLPLRFTASLCEDGSFWLDEAVEVRVEGPGGDEVASWGLTGNPSTGVDVTGVAYHVNWRTERGARGPHTVTATFSNGEVLTRVVELR